MRSLPPGKSSIDTATSRVMLELSTKPSVLLELCTAQAGAERAAPSNTKQNRLNMIIEVPPRSVFSIIAQ
jgi:hypothetical protein